MRTYLMIAAGLALSASPALGADIYDYPPAASPVYAPQSLVTGHVEIMGGGVFASGFDSMGVISGAGRATVPLGQLMKLELEVTGGSMFRDGTGANSFGAYAHLYGDGPSHALGAFGGYTNLGGYSAPTFGLEGYFNLTPSTVLWGQGAYLFNSDVQNVAYLRGVIHQYFSLNTRATIDTAWAFGDSFDSAWNVTGSIEHRFVNTPWSLFGAVGVSGVRGSDVHPWTAMVGARLFVDQPGSTLASHDKAVPWNVRIPVVPSPSSPPPI